MKPSVVQGQYIVVAAMAVTIGVALLMLNLPFGGFASTSVVFVLIALSLYDGQSWARWVLAGLIVVGLIVFRDLTSLTAE